MARYTPGKPPDDQKQIAAYIIEEYAKIAQAMDTPDQFLMLSTLYAAPRKIIDGMIVKADGTVWDPGSGSGVYVYRDAAWHLLG